jgi:hypothetical protein
LPTFIFKEWPIIGLGKGVIDCAKPIMGAMNERSQA